MPEDWAAINLDMLTSASSTLGLQETGILSCQRYRDAKSHGRAVRDTCKAKFRIQETMRILEQLYGRDRLCPATITFRAGTDHGCASRALRGVLRSMRRPVDGYVSVLGHQENGTLHGHALLVCRASIAGADRQSRKELASLRRALRACTKRHLTGFADAGPIRTTTAKLSRYTANHLDGRRVKGFRYFSYSGAAKKVSGRFTMLDSGSNHWRRCVGLWAVAHGRRDLAEVEALFGKRWAYFNFGPIISFGHRRGMVTPDGELSLAH